MDFELIAAVNLGWLGWLLDPENWPIVAAVAAGIGLVIFVHELGHFAVAKWCGVKCEKFYLGFDIGGWKFCKFQWGETEYGIGILPLGGYVKMLGQEDNPQRMQEEFERSKLRPEGEPTAQDETGEPFVLDPRSFLAKSVPQRMAIISAGVIMNVVFCFVVSSIAYGLGVEQVACTVGGTMPGGPAWKSGNLLPGDEVIQIGSVKHPVWRDLQRNVMVGDNLDQGVPFVIRRPGANEPIEVRVVPNRTRGARLVGLSSGHTNVLAKHPVSPYSPLAALKKGFRPNDHVAAINGKPVKTFVELDRMLYAHREAITVAVERELGGAAQAAPTEPIRTENVTIEVPSVPMRSTGIVMQLGAIAAVQDGSPAAGADIRAGDRLKTIDGEAPGDPLRLPDQLAARGGAKVTLEIEREGKTMTKQIVLRDYYGGAPQLIGNDPLDVPALGVAIIVENQVAAVEPGSPAEKAGVKAGDEIVHARLIPPDADQQRRDGIDPVLEKNEEFKFDVEKNRNWLVLFEMLQGWLRGTKVELTLKEGDRKVTIEPRPVNNWLNPDRGFRFRPVIVLQKAESVGEAAGLGLFETEYALSLVYRFLRKLLSGDVSPKLLGGPIEIARQAGGAASAGMSPFLIFLGMLSANLAVINFLPIPLLDGGHMVFLVLEGIRRKPASEKLATVCQFAGLFLLLSLMAFVIMLDLGVIPRG